MTHSDPWAHLLDPDENILWQGSPEARLRIEWSTPFHPFFYIFFTGFSIFWMVMASMAGGIFWMFGLLFFFVGTYNLVGVHFWKNFQRKHTNYTLTTKRAFIATSMFGKKTLQSYPITAQAPLEFSESGDLSEIFFAEKSTRGENGTQLTKIGFSQLRNGRNVYAHFREVQRSQESNQT